VTGVVRMHYGSAELPAVLLLLALLAVTYLE
jgi:hypothetical protein